MTCSILDVELLPRSMLYSICVDYILLLNLRAFWFSCIHTFVISGSNFVSRVLAESIFIFEDQNDKTNCMKTIAAALVLSVLDKKQFYLISN